MEPRSQGISCLPELPVLPKKGASFSECLVVLLFH